MDIIISFVCGGLVMFVGLTRSYRRYMRLVRFRYQEYDGILTKKEADVKQKTKAIREIIYDAHHNSANENLKRIRGLVGISRMAGAILYNNLELAQRPHHHGYAKTAVTQLDEMFKYFELIDKQAKIGEEKIIKNVDRFNHLQE